MSQYLKLIFGIVFKRLKLNDVQIKQFMIVYSVVSVVYVCGAVLLYVQQSNGGRN
jgi:hypothetical protein